MLDISITRSPVTRFARMVIVTAGCAAVTFVATVAGQSPFATFGGVVRDQLGGTIPNATISVTHALSGAKHEIRTNERGTFEFVGLVPGTYAVAATPPGFKVFSDSLQLTAGQTARRDILLAVGTLQETITIVGGPPAPPRPSRPVSIESPACTTAPNSGGIRPPKKVVDMRPRYPASMQNTGIEGRVELHTVIGLDGTVKEVQTTEATNTDFELAAIEAVRQWRFTQTLLNCVPIEVEMNVLSTFRPEGSAPPPPPPPPPPPVPPVPPVPPAPRGV